MGHTILHVKRNAADYMLAWRGSHGVHCILTAHRDSLSSEMKSGVLSHPEMQCTSSPPSPENKT